MVSTYLWMQAFSGGAEVAIRPPSIDAFRRELVPALVDLAEPQRAAAGRAPVGVRVELGRAAGRTDDRLGAEPVVRPTPGPAPEPPAPGPGPPPPGPGPREPGTPPTAPGVPPAGPTVPEPPSSPGAPDPTPAGGSPGPTGGVRPPAAVQPTAGTPDATSAETGRKRPEKAAKRERPAPAQEARGATPARPAIPPRPQEQKPTTAPAATPAHPAVPPAHSSAHRKDDAGETAVTASPAPAPATEQAEKAEHGHGNSGGNRRQP